MEKSKKILKVENLKKAYYSTSRTGEIITYPVLNNVSFEIEEGEFVGIMGRSGCGKTIQNAKSAVSFPLPGNRTFSFYIFHRRKSQKAEPFLGSAFF